MECIDQWLTACESCVQCCISELQHEIEAGAFTPAVASAGYRRSHLGYILTLLHTRYAFPVAAVMQVVLLS